MYQSKYVWKKLLSGICGPCFVYMKYKAITIIALKGLIIAKAKLELLDLMQKGEFHAQRIFVSKQFRDAFQNNRWRLCMIGYYFFVLLTIRVFLDNFEYAICGCLRKFDMWGSFSIYDGTIKLCYTSCQQQMFESFSIQ